MGKIIAVASGKGGTGKTTTVAAVASCLAALGHKTLCADFDCKTHALDLALCVADRAGASQLDQYSNDVFVSGSCFEHPRIPNLFLLPVHSVGDPDKADPSDIFPLFDEIRDNFDYCLIDTPTGAGAGCRLAHADADISMIVTTGESATMIDAREAANRILDMGVSDIRLIVNRVLPKNLKMLQTSIDAFIDDTGLRPIGMIPEDNAVFRAFYDSIPLILYYKRRAAYHFLDISRRIAGEAAPWRMHMNYPVYTAFSQVPQPAEQPEDTPPEPLAPQPAEQPEDAPSEPLAPQPAEQPEETLPEPLAPQPAEQLEDTLPEPLAPQPAEQPEVAVSGLPPSEGMEHSDSTLPKSSSLQILEQLDALLESYPSRKSPAQSEASDSEPPSQQTPDQGGDEHPNDVSGYPPGLIELIPEHLIGEYGDPKLWARSTFVPDENEPLILIKEIRPTGQNSRETFMRRTWLHDALDDHNIPYHIEIGDHWKGRKGFSEIQNIYVKKAHGGKAISLIRAHEVPLEPVPERLKAVYGDPSLWARSTFEPEDDEALVLIHEIKPSGQTGREMFMHRTWVHDLFDDNNIPYYIEIGGHWKSRKNFSEIQSIYVRKAQSGKAISLMRAYDNPENLIKDAEAEKEKEEVIVSRDGVPQKNCPSCGKTVDFDHYKCPHCKAIMAMDDTMY